MAIYILLVYFKNCQRTQKNVYLRNQLAIVSAEVLRLIRFHRCK